MSNALLAAAVAVGLILFHLQQVDKLSDSIGEYWKRTDTPARRSKLCFGLSLGSCTVILFWPTFGIFCAVVLMAASTALSMNGWRS